MIVFSKEGPSLGRLPNSSSDSDEEVPSATLLSLSLVDSMAYQPD